MKCRSLLALILLVSTQISLAQDNSKQKVLEVYGFVMADVGYNFDQINPNWYDAMRISRLPSHENQFAPDGKVFFGVRQTRFGVRGWTQTPIGELKTTFEFDMFGVGADEGQTTMRLRHAWAEIGRFGAGQTNSPFMDGDVWPNTVEYWGPSGMVFFRNVQVRYAPMMGDNELFLALERPGASADLGSFENRIELDSVVGQLQLPDFSAHYKRSGKWGHIQLAGMLRELKWKDIHKSGGYDLSDEVLGWGAHLSAVINIGKMIVFRGSYVYGEGIQNYMQDAPVDIGAKENPGNTAKPFTGKPLPVTGIHAFVDLNWSPTLCTAIGYSTVDIENTESASPSAYKMGQYAIVNLVATPFKNAMIAAEVQWGRRTNLGDGFTSDAIKLHFAFKYNFSEIFYKHAD